MEENQKVTGKTEGLNTLKLSQRPLALKNSSRYVKVRRKINKVYPKKLPSLTLKVQKDVSFESMNSNDLLRVARSFFRTSNELIGAWRWMYGETNRPINLPRIYTDKQILVSKDLGLVLEESREILDAINENDRAEILDGIIDLSWVIANFGHWLGSKEIMTPDVATVRISFYGLVNKSEKSKLSTLKTSILDLVSLLDARNNVDGLIDKLSYIRCFLVGYVLSEKGSPQIAFSNVCMANFSKICVTLEEAEQTKKMYELEKGIHVMIEQSPTVPDVYMIKRTSDKKILKSINWECPIPFEI